MNRINNYKSIETDNPNNDYYGYPFNIWAFGLSMKNSCLEEHNGVFLRVLGKNATIIYSDDPIDYNSLFEVLSKYGIENVKRLPSLRKNEGDDKSTPCWFTSEMIGQKHINRCRFFTFREPNNIDEVTTVFDKWVELRKDALFCLVKGHYQSLIHLHMMSQEYPMEIHLTCQDGKPVGITGWIIDEKYSQAVLPLAKHNFTHKYLADAIWAHGIRFLLEERGIKSVNCGDTADKMKERFEFKKQKVWYFSKKKLGKKEEKHEFW